MKLTEDEEREAREFLALPDFKSAAARLNPKAFPVVMIVTTFAAVLLLGFGGMMLARTLEEMLGLTVYWQLCATFFPPAVFLMFYSRRFERVNSTVLALLIFTEARLFARRRSIDGKAFFARIRSEYPATFANSYWRRRAIAAGVAAARGDNKR